MLEIKNLSCGYGGTDVVKNVSFSVPSKKVTAVIGLNGSGKTTLLKAICRILPATAGNVTLDGTDLFALAHRLFAQKIAYLSQARPVPDITVGRMVLHGRFPYQGYPRRYRPEDQAIAEDAMRRMDILEYAARPLSSLSGGQRQKAYIAMALAQCTPVLLLDEPMTYLDVANQLRVSEYAKELASADKHIVLTIHDIAMALETADLILLLDKGTARFYGTPEELYLSGLADEVFGVKIGRIMTESGLRYYYGGRKA